MKKNFRELLRHLPPGYSIGWPRSGEPSRPLGIHGHQYVLDPDGKPVRDGRGIPLRVCSSPRQSAFRSDLREVIKLAERIKAQG